MDPVSTAPDGSPEPRIPYRIALLDDHVLVVDGLSRWIEVNAPDFAVTVAAGSWSDLVGHPSFPPDIVVMARVIEEPVSLHERIRFCRNVGARVVVMSSEAGKEAEREALAAGASAFVPKSRPAEAVVDAARRAMIRGDAIAQPSCPLDAAAVPHRELDDWERRVLRLYASGHSTVDIAVIEGVRFERVRTALKQIREGYEAQDRRVATREDLLRRAAEDGYLAEEA